MSDERRQYEEWLHAEVAKSIQEGSSTLRAVVARCKGADPLTVRRVLNMGSVAGSDSLPIGMAAPLLTDDGPVEPRLPAPHPLDFEWRFSRRGAESLLDVARGLGGGDLLLLAATTVAITAGRNRWEGRIVALDQFQILLAAAAVCGAQASFVVTDVARGPVLDEIADVVVMDPPWYPEYAASFFYAAAAACRRGGYVLACLPGEGTRPGLERERTELARTFKALGLTLQGVTSQFIRYETPHFEWNAFLAAGLTGDHRLWRLGDLWVLRRTEIVRPERPATPGDTENWEEVSIGRMRVRFLTGQMRSGNTALGSIVDGDILPTVTRRDPRRAAARVWTSGNRVFSCNDPDTLLAAVRARVRGQDPVAAAARALGRRPSASERLATIGSCGQLSELSDREQDEQAADAAGERRGKGVAA